MKIKEYFEEVMADAGLSFFWLYENTCNIRISDREEISGQVNFFQKNTVSVLVTF